MSEQETITLSSGVVLRLMKPSRFLLQEKARQMTPKMPKVPVVFIEAKGREEDNPGDPAYIEAVQAWSNEWARATENATILMGTAIESVPEGFQRPEDEEWAQELADAYGLEVPSSKPLRYCMWLKLVAIRTEDDAQLVKERTDNLLGIPQRKVSEAMESFRDREERPADMDAPAEEQS